jgi:folate-binding protein YgfZ
MADGGNSRVAVDFGDPRAEYEAALHDAAIYDARHRGLIEVTGKDRAAWLHNLVTNTVKTLRPGEGNYAFATNAKGRILFDCNILVLPDAIWLDVGRQVVPKALAHLEHYHIAEDVRLVDRSDAFCRVALLGPRAADIMGALGATHAGRLPSLASSLVTLEGKSRFMVRHDFAGVLGLELYIEPADAAACWSRLLDLGRPMLRPIGQSAVEVLRIEAGIPVYGLDIDEKILPAETQQIERGISYVKGCYLGQEIVERMRSRGVLARTLTGFKLTSSAGVHPGSQLKAGDATVGRITSLCDSYAAGGTIALGYVKTALGAPGTTFTVDAPAPVSAQVVPLPFRAWRQ